MQAITLDEAASDLSRLVERAAKGEAFVITDAGRPLVKVVPLDDADKAGTPRRLGFLKGEIAAPDDFDRMGSTTIERLFGGDA